MGSVNAGEAGTQMEESERGGLQRWQLTIIHLSRKVKESCYINFNGALLQCRAFFH